MSRFPSFLTCVHTMQGPRTQASMPTTVHQICCVHFSIAWARENAPILSPAHAFEGGGTNECIGIAYLQISMLT